MPPHTTERPPEPQPEPALRLDEHCVAAYVRGVLSEPQRLAVERALDENPRWLAVVALLARGGGEGDVHEGVEPDGVAWPTGGVPAAGVRVGRYVLGHLLGRGASGVVCAAWDPELRRDVALKLVDPALMDDPTKSQQRLSREAKALAKVEDPHVVSVFDVGAWRGRLFIAMERLDGGTLDQWRAEAARGWREIVQRYVDAAKGLAAAHRHALVHRDFKPSNAMIDDQGRVVVVDFGLAREAAMTLSRPPELESADAPAPIGLTKTGTTLGTPAYMAPEQRTGQGVTASADQYALCTSLHEALATTLPDGTVRRALPPMPELAPGALWRVLERGRAQAPTQRYRDMGALIAALQATLHSKRRRGRWIIVGLALTSVAGALSLFRGASNPRDPGATDPFAPATREPIGMLAEAELDPEALAIHQALGALQQRRLTGEFDGLVERSEAVVSRADAFGDDDLRLRARLHLGIAYENAGRLDQALAVYDAGAQISMAAELAEYATNMLTARAWIAIRWERDDTSARRSLEHAAAWSKRAQGRPALEGERLRVLGHVEMIAGDLEAGDAAFAAAYAIAESLPEDEPENLELRIVTGADWGSLLVARGDFEGARMRFEDAASLQARRVGPSHPIVAEMNNNVAALHRESGELAQAKTIFEANLEIFTSKLGPENPRVGSTLVNLAVVEMDLGRAAVAVTHATEAVRIFNARHGAESAIVATATMILGEALLEAGRLDEAIATLSEARALLASERGEAHPELGKADVVLARTLLRLGRHEKALATALGAVRVLEAASDSDAPELAGAYTLLGEVRVALHDHVAAHEAFDRALALADMRAEPAARVAKGALLLAQSRAKDAAFHLDRACASLRQMEGDPARLKAAQALLDRARTQSSSR